MADQKELKEIHEMTTKLASLGASDEEIIKLWKAALETADKIIKEA